jgi:hypothetical protein
MESFAEIAVRMARQVARQRGCTLQSLSLDAVDIEHDDTGTEIVHVIATIQIRPVMDEIPWAGYSNVA